MEYQFMIFGMVFPMINEYFVFWKFLSIINIMIVCINAFSPNKKKNCLTGIISTLDTMQIYRDKYTNKQKHFLDRGKY